MIQLSGLYSEVQSDLAKMQLPCKKACTTCCHYTIKMTELESLLILSCLKMLDGKQGMKIAANMQKHLQHIKADKTLDEAYQNGDLTEIEERTFANKMPCPFLVDDECGIYPARPLICRAYFHTNGPAICNTNITDPKFAKYWSLIQKKLYAIHAQNGLDIVFTLLPLYCLDLLKRMG